MRFSITTLGCKVNQYESQAIESILISRGHIKVESYTESDVCLINTCAVTAESVRKSRQALRRIRKSTPTALIAVFGCFSQLEPKIPVSLGADIISGTDDRLGFIEKIEQLCENKTHNETAAHRSCENPTAPASPILQTDSEDSQTLIEDLPPGKSRERTRATLKIQDGCDNYCTYCIVPHARGRSRSLPLSRIAEYAERIANEGFREIVVTGIEISSYGKDLPATPPLTEALAVISKAAPNTRIRLGSLDPAAITKEFCIELQNLPNLCNSFHLSLQSGSDDILRKMGRRYNTADVSETITRLRDMFPNCGITADLIVGFPGETDDDFDKTLTFIKNSAFSNMHIFPFSPRPGTPAADMPNQVSKTIRRERARIISDAAAEMALDFRHSQIGKTVQVLFEQKRDGLWIGYSENYIQVAVKTTVEKNTIHPVKILSVESEHTFGELVHHLPNN